MFASSGLFFAPLPVRQRAFGSIALIAHPSENPPVKTVFGVNVFRNIGNPWERVFHL